MALNTQWLLLPPRCLVVCRLTVTHAKLLFNYYLLLLLRKFVERKIRINTPNALSQQLNRNVFSLALQTSGEMSGDRSSAGKLFQTTGPLTAKLRFP